MFIFPPVTATAPQHFCMSFFFFFFHQLGAPHNIFSILKLYVSTATSTVHVDAPQRSTSGECIPNQSAKKIERYLLFKLKCRIFVYIFLIYFPNFWFLF